MKRYLSLILTFVLIFNFSFISFSYGDVIDDLIMKNPDTVVNYGDSDFDNSNKNDATINQKSGSVDFGILSFVVDIIRGILDLLTIPLASLTLLLPTIDSCIFNGGSFLQSPFRISYFDISDSNLINSTTSLSGALLGPVSAIYNALRYLVTAVYIIVLVYLAIRMMLSSVGRQKALYKELFKHWIVGLLLLFSFHWVMAGILWLSNQFVDMLGNLAFNLLNKNSVISLFGLSDTILAKTPITNFILNRINGALLTELVTTDLLGSCFAIACLICLIGSTFNIVIVYFKRLFTITLLIILFPLVALSYVFDKIGDRKAQTFNTWFREFTVNVMIQPLHALILLFIALLFSTYNDTVITSRLYAPSLLGAIFSILTLRLIPVGENLLKQLFQIKSQTGPGADGITGTVAKAGLALRGLQQMGGMAMKLGKGASDALNSAKARGLVGENFFNQPSLAKRLRQNGLKQTAADSLSNIRKLGSGIAAGTKGAVASGKKAKDDYKAANQKNRRGVLNAALEGGVKNFAQSVAGNNLNKEAWKDFMDGIRKDTKSNSNVAAVTKLTAPYIGAALGVGSAITGAKDNFLSDAASRAVLGGALAQGITELPQKMDTFRNGDPKKAEEYTNLLNDFRNCKKIEDLSPDKQRKLQATFNLPLTLLNERRDDVIAGLGSIANAAKFGIEGEKLQEFSSLHKESESFKKGELPDGTKIDFTDPNFIRRVDQDSFKFSGDGVFALVTDNTTGEKVFRQISDINTKGAQAELARSLKGQALTEENLMPALNNSEYNELQAKLGKLNTELATQTDVRKKTFDEYTDTHSKAIAAQQSMSDQANIQAEAKSKLDDANARLAADPSNATIAREVTVREQAYKDETSKYEQLSRKFQALNKSDLEKEAEYKAAESKESRTKSDIKKIEDSMSKIYKEERNKQLEADKILRTLGFDPYYANTAFTAVAENFSTGTLSSNSSGTFVNLPGMSYPLDNTPGSDVTIGYDAIHKVQEHIANRNTTFADLDSQLKAYAQKLSSSSGNLAAPDVQIARAAVATTATDARNLFTSQVSDFTADPTKVSSPDLSSIFSVIKSAQAATGQNFINIATLTEDGFERGTCMTLEAFLDNWKTEPITITFKRNSRTELKYVINSEYSHAEIAHDTITINEHFNCPQLANAGDTLKVKHNDDGAWFITK